MQERPRELIKELNGLGRDDTKNKKIADRIERKLNHRRNAVLWKRRYVLVTLMIIYDWKRHHSIHPPQTWTLSLSSNYIFLYSGYRWIVMIYLDSDHVCAPPVFARSRHSTSFNLALNPTDLIVFYPKFIFLLFIDTASQSRNNQLLPTRLFEATTLYLTFNLIASYIYYWISLLFDFLLFTLWCRVWN